MTLVFHYLGGCSTTQALVMLVELVHMWLAGIEELGKAVRIVFLDFRKAFDKVDHSILLGKLLNAGIPDMLMRWVTAFLCDHQQQVKLGSCMSELTQGKAEVPQGTLLGPLGFVCHINDLNNVCDTVKYIDDSTIWEVCDRKGEDSQIQLATNQAIEWTDKTKNMVIYYGQRELIAPPIVMNGYEIEHVSTSKLLSVILNDTLTWGDHVDYICRKASARLYFLTLLKRTGYSSPDIVEVYAAITRSVLEYACEVWHPGLSKSPVSVYQTHSKTCTGHLLP